MIFVYNDKFVLHLIGGVAIFPERYIYIYIYVYDSVSNKEWFI